MGGREAGRWEGEGVGDRDPSMKPRGALDPCFKADNIPQPDTVRADENLINPKAIAHTHTPGTPPA